MTSTSALTGACIDPLVEHPGHDIVVVSTEIVCDVCDVDLDVSGSQIERRL